MREGERRGWICDVERASVLVRVKLFSLVFVRTHRLVSARERERERSRERMRREPEERKREGWRGGEER